MEDGDSLRRACDRVGITRWSFLRWVDADFDGLAHRYARARERLLDCLAEDIIDIADVGRAERELNERDKLRIESRKWTLSKLKPEQYGDKSTQTIDMTLKGEDPATVLAARRKAREGE
jgi:hypothetical protein